jgi:hypothetical protein
MTVKHFTKLACQLSCCISTVDISHLLIVRTGEWESAITTIVRVEINQGENVMAYFPHNMARVF